MKGFNLLCLLPTLTLAWDVARTPPMGFNTWNLYHCSVNATILTDTATAMVKSGLKDAGYIYVNSDDCWMSFNRSANGSQVPDPTKFPDGFAAVTDFIHGLGMKSGLYTAKGPHTCQKRAASCLHEEQDAKSWASWGIDYVKDDSCSTCKMPNGTSFTDMEDYHRMWQAIQNSGRPMVLTVEGSPPANIITHGGYGNAKRVGHDISPSWGSMISLVDIGSGLWPYAHGSQDATYGGWWNDLDMIEIGNGGPRTPPPGPPAPPSPPPAPGSLMYPWAIAPESAGAGWTMESDGTIRNGGLCLTAGGRLTLTPCDTTKAHAQQWTLEANGNLHPKTASSACAALLGGCGPALTQAACKTGSIGLNEMFTYSNGQICSKILSTGAPRCLKPEAAQPDGSGCGSANENDGFNCVANTAALERCRVHMTMWTIMKAPLLLGNNIPKMDDTALSVVMNKDAIAISQDPLGVQARRLWTTQRRSTHDRDLSEHRARSVVAVAAQCDKSRPTQVWSNRHGILKTSDKSGVEWCLHDVDGKEQVGSWRGVPCDSIASKERSTAIFHHAIKPNSSKDPSIVHTALVTPSGSHLTWNNAHGASGPVPHTRYLTAFSGDSSTDMAWYREKVQYYDESFRLRAADDANVLDDDKQGAIFAGGDFCLDLVEDADSEVWAGPLVNETWAVALLNRDPTSQSSITVNFTMFNASTTSNFAIKDVWQEKSVGTHIGSYTAVVPPQAVTYLLLTPV